MASLCSLLDRIADVVLCAEPTAALTWQSAAGIIRQKVGLATDHTTDKDGFQTAIVNPAQVTATKEEFAQLCLDLGLQLTAHGATFYRHTMRTIQKNVELGSNREQATAQLNAYLDGLPRHGQETIDMFATTATNQNIGFHLLRCAFSLHHRDGEPLKIAAALVDALEAHDATPPRPLMDVQQPASSLPAFGSALVNFAHTSNNPNDLARANSLGYILGWAQFSITEFDDMADKALCTMLFNFMVMNHPDMFTRGAGWAFKEALDRYPIPPLREFSEVQDALMAVFEIKNGESAASIASTFRSIYALGTIQQHSVGARWHNAVNAATVWEEVTDVWAGGIPGKCVVVVSSPVWVPVIGIMGGVQGFGRALLSLSFSIAVMMARRANRGR